MKVLGMGDNVVDRYISKKRMFPGGNAVNFAAYAAMQGVKSSFLGNIAPDIQGDLIKKALTTLGVGLGMGPEMEKGFRTQCCDVIHKNGDRVFVGSSFNKGAPPPAVILRARDIAGLDEFDLIHCGCYGAMENEIKKLGDVTALRTFDFSEEEEFRQKGYLEKICPFIDMALFSGSRLETDAERQLVKKVRRLGTPYVLITRGIDGQTFYSSQGLWPGRAEQIDHPLDTMGAGDSFFSAFVLMLLKSGWTRSQGVDDAAVAPALSAAARFSARVCMVEGAFGFGADFD